MPWLLCTVIAYASISGSWLRDARTLSPSFISLLSSTITFVSTVSAPSPRLTEKWETIVKRCLKTMNSFYIPTKSTTGSHWGKIADRPWDFSNPTTTPLAPFTRPLAVPKFFRSITCTDSTNIDPQEQH